MKRTFQNHFLFLLITTGILLSLGSCSKDETNDVGVSDKIFYEQVAYTIIKCYTDIYNQNLAGKPTGNQYITTTAPLGGNVIISGSNSYDSTHAITTTDITFALSNVIGSATTSSDDGKTTCTTQIMITGTTTYKGSFSSTYTSISHQSQNLHVVGTVTYAGSTRNIDMTGVVNINRTTSVTASLFGNNVSW
jgi:hypothetical protein